MHAPKLPAGQVEAHRSAAGGDEGLLKRDGLAVVQLGGFISRMKSVDGDSGAF